MELTSLSCGILAVDVSVRATGRRWARGRSVGGCFSR